MVPLAHDCPHLINFDISEATLKKLLAEQRTIIEEIKQKTNYYSTRNLLERYDNKPSSVPQTPQNPSVSMVRKNSLSLGVG